MQQKGISALRPAAHLNPDGGSGLTADVIELAPVAIARLLVGGDVSGALEQLEVAVAESQPDEPRLIQLAFSAVVRAGSACPELQWLAGLLGVIPDVAERGAAALQLIQFLPQESLTRADVTATAADCVGGLWSEAPQVAAGLLVAICDALIALNDQSLLAATADVLLGSLPPGYPAERNSLGYLLITSLNNSGNIAASVHAMRDLLGDLVEEPWDRGNFELLISIASLAAQAAGDALAGDETGVVTEAVAVADRAFGLIERVDASDIQKSEAEYRDMQHRISVAFSRFAAVARSLTQEANLEVTKPNPAAFFRFRQGDVDAAGTPNSPARSARISEARFLEECARVDWKAIPTPLEVDFGLDYRIEIPEQPGKTSADFEFLVQLKSTSASPNASGLLTVSIDPTTLKYWKSKVLPTLVVLFHHPTDTFYTSWFFPALEDNAQRTFRFAREDEWDPITLRTDVQRYYQHVRTALASGGDWSLLSVMQLHCALLIKTILLHPDIRRAALDPDADLSGAKTDQAVSMLLLMHHRALCGPAPILADQQDVAEIVKPGSTA